MTSRCVDPAVGDDVLDCVRPGGGPLGAEQLLHLEVCESCRASVEQLRRLAGAWRTLEPTLPELRAARARFLGRGGKRRSARVVPKAAALVVVLAAAAASAAVRVAVTRLVTPSIPPSAATADRPPLAPSKRPHLVGHRARTVDAGVAADPSVEEAAVPEVALPEVVPEVAAPAVAIAEVSVDDLPRAPAPPVVPQRRVSAGPSVAAAPAPEAGAPPSPWMVAASAMRAGDYARAEAAFEELSRAPEASTRDAARLARAQVWIAEGRTGEARPELEGLAAEGATPLVRKRAADALDALR